MNNWRLVPVMLLIMVSWCQARDLIGNASCFVYLEGREASRFLRKNQNKLVPCRKIFPYFLLSQFLIHTLEREIAFKVYFRKGDIFRKAPLSYLEWDLHLFSYGGHGIACIVIITMYHTFTTSRTSIKSCRKWSRCLIVC